MEANLFSAHFTQELLARLPLSVKHHTDQTPGAPGHFRRGGFHQVKKQTVTLMDGGR